MAELKNDEYNQFLMDIAEAAQKAKDFGNKARVPESVPLVGGMGAGDLLLGKTPDEVKEWAYGNSPVEVKPMERLPSLKKGRAQQVVDTAFTGLQAGGLAKATGSAIKRGAYALKDALKPKDFDPARRELLTLPEESPTSRTSPTDKSPVHEESITSDGMTRRDFMKAAGAVGAAVAAAPLLKGMAEHGTESAVEHVVAPASERAFEDTLIHTAEDTGANIAEKVGFRGLLGKMMEEHVYQGWGEGYLENMMEDAPANLRGEGQGPMQAFDTHMEQAMDEVSSKFTPKQQALLEKAQAKLSKYPEDIKSHLFYNYPGENPEYQIFTRKEKAIMKDVLEDEHYDVADWADRYSQDPSDTLDQIFEAFDGEREISPDVIHVLDPSLPHLTVEESKAYERFLSLTSKKMNEFFPKVDDPLLRTWREFSNRYSSELMKRGNRKGLEKEIVDQLKKEGYDTSEWNGKLPP